MNEAIPIFRERANLDSRVPGATGIQRVLMILIVSMSCQDIPSHHVEAVYILDKGMSILREVIRL